MVLKQCANFYNNISSEMLPCQKPMMLADALEFEKVRLALYARCYTCLRARPNPQT